MQRLATACDAWQSGSDLGVVEAGLPAGDLCRLLLLKATDAILAVAMADGRILTANARVEDLTGFPVATLLGANVDKLVPGASDFASDGLALSRDILQHVGLHEEIRVRRADDYVAYVSMTVGHVATATDTVAVCIMRDASERRLLERELITKHAALQQTHADLQRVANKLTRRNAELVDLQNRIASLAKQAAIGAMTAGVAHSVNNPLSALLSSARRMQESLAELPSHPGIEHLQVLNNRVIEAGRRISRVVEDMRCVHRQGGARPEPGPVDVAEEIDAVLTLFSERLLNAEVSTSFNVKPCKVEAFPDELQHLIANLIDNALAATGGRCRLQIDVICDAEALRLTVADDGPGLSSTVGNRLFEPFVTNRAGGTGLGLWMCQNIAHHHRGSLRYLPNEPHGTRFILEIPASQSSGTTQEATR